VLHGSTSREKDFANLEKSAFYTHSRDGSTSKSQQQSG